MPVVQRARRAVAPRLRRGLNRVDSPEVRAARRLLRSRRRQPSDVLHFGASESLFTAPDDDDQRTLAGMLADDFAPRRSIHSVIGPAYHPKLISEYVRLISTEPAPEVVLLGIPVRIGQRPWARHPLYSYAVATAALERMAPTRASFRVRKAVRPTTEQQMRKFDRLPFRSLIGDGDIGDLRRRLKDPAAAGLSETDAAKLIYAYHHGSVDDLDPDWVAGLDALAHRLGRLGSRVVVYHPPIPIERAVAMFGEPIRQINAVNVERIHAVLTAACSDIRFVDSALSFDDTCFIDPSDATEHLNETGRCKLASRIVEQVEAPGPQAGPAGSGDERAGRNS